MKFLNRVIFIIFFRCTHVQLRRAQLLRLNINARFRSRMKNCVRL